MSDIDRKVGELQTFIERAVLLLPSRFNHFFIDPGDSCTPILKGAEDLFQLEAAWDILRTRLETGQRFFTKYIEEFKESQNVPDSPSSTAIAVHEQLKSIPKINERLRVIMHDFPRR
ncbi:hypothetical protein R3P38DRAFT_3219420 [Favolaschia claudopus]|uniref:Uncharacterized protein n=1 Tax=Favolaschia claudopus TaxID=2862362 RepID=A0AAW0A242_9AGAR